MLMSTTQSICGVRKVLARWENRKGVPSVQQVHDLLCAVASGLRKEEALAAVLRRATVLLPWTETMLEANKAPLPGRNLGGCSAAAAAELPSLLLALLMQCNNRGASRVRARTFCNARMGPMSSLLRVAGRPAQTKDCYLLQAKVSCGQTVQARIHTVHTHATITRGSSVVSS